LTVTKLLAPDSTAAVTKVTGLCPSLGQGWMFLHPVVHDPFGKGTAGAAKALASVDEVKAAVTAMEAEDKAEEAANPSHKHANHA